MHYILNIYIYECVCVSLSAYRFPRLYLLLMSFCIFVKSEQRVGQQNNKSTTQYVVVFIVVSQNVAVVEPRTFKYSGNTINITLCGFP